MKPQAGDPSREEAGSEGIAGPGRVDDLGIDCAGRGGFASRSVSAVTRAIVQSSRTQSSCAQGD